MKYNKIWAVVFTALTLLSCKKEYSTGGGSPQFTPPPHFPEPVYTFKANPLTKNGIALGKKLFYDPILSADNSISCGSCHAQMHAFADHNVAFSTGVGGKLGKRNSPTLANLAWYPHFMADGGINHIEVQPLAPITDSLEMAETMSNVVQKLSADSTYRALFKKAFKTNVIDDQKIFYALAQFMGTIISANSDYDKYINGRISYNASQEKGLELFRQHCESCHKEPLFTDFSFKNNGIDTAFADIGRGRITQDYNDYGKFKVPTLRNIEMTYPYMHDGRFYNLEDVIDHYSEGIKESHSKDASVNNLHLTAQEKKDLINFLKTLTDYSYMSNINYAE